MNQTITRKKLSLIFEVSKVYICRIVQLALGTIYRGEFSFSYSFFSTSEKYVIYLS